MTAKQYIENKIEELTIEMERQYAAYKNINISNAIREFAYTRYLNLNYALDVLEKDLKEE